MFRDEHIGGGIERIKSENSELYNGNEDIIKKILEEITDWFDELSKGVPNERKLEVRKIRHHLEGIEEISGILSKKYDEKFHGIIRSEAERHVLTDTYWMIPRKIDYEDPNFWARAQANNSSNWL